MCILRTKTLLKLNKRTNGPVNAHLISGATVSTKTKSQNLTLS